MVCTAHTPKPATWRLTEEQQKKRRANQFRTFVRRLTPEQREIFYAFYEEVSNGGHPKRPEFMPKAYNCGRPSLEKIFGSMNAFWRELRSDLFKGQQISPSYLKKTPSRSKTDLQGEERLLYHRRVRFLEIVLNFTPEKRVIFDKYWNDVISDIKCERPAFLHRTFLLTKENIINIFGSIESFVDEMKRV